MPSGKDDSTSHIYDFIQDWPQLHRFCREALLRDLGKVVNKVQGNVQHLLQHSLCKPSRLNTIHPRWLEGTGLRFSNKSSGASESFGQDDLDPKETTTLVHSLVVDMRKEGYHREADDLRAAYGLQDSCCKACMRSASHPNPVEEGP